MQLKPLVYKVANLMIWLASCKGCCDELVAELEAQELVPGVTQFVACRVMFLPGPHAGQQLDSMCMQFHAKEWDDLCSLHVLPSFHKFLKV